MCDLWKIHLFFRPFEPLFTHIHTNSQCENWLWIFLRNIYFIQIQIPEIPNTACANTHAPSASSPRVVFRYRKQTRRTGPDVPACFVRQFREYACMHAHRVQILDILYTRLLRTYVCPTRSPKLDLFNGGCTRACCGILEFGFGAARLYRSTPLRYVFYAVNQPGQAMKQIKCTIQCWTITHIQYWNDYFEIALNIVELYYIRNLYIWSNVWSNSFIIIPSIITLYKY